MKRPIYVTTVNHSEQVIAHECASCEWIGDDDDKVQVRIDREYNITESRCPQCGHAEFYGITGYK